MECCTHIELENDPVPTRTAVVADAVFVPFPNKLGLLPHEYNVPSTVFANVFVPLVDAESHVTNVLTLCGPPDPTAELPVRIVPSAYSDDGSTIVNVIGVNKLPLIEPDTVNDPVTLFGPVTDEVNIPLAEYTVGVYVPSDPVIVTG